MKQCAIFLAMFFIASHSAATIHTVSNMSFSPGQYPSLDAALVVAVTGDTILYARIHH